MEIWKYKHNMSHLYCMKLKLFFWFSGKKNYKAEKNIRINSIQKNYNHYNKYYS